MRALSPQEKRTIRIGAIGIAVYLVLFCGYQGWRGLSKQRAEYQKLVKEAVSLKAQVRLYEDRTSAIRKLMEGFRMDPARLSKPAVVAQASAAIQAAAKASGVQVGPVREGAGRPSNKELGTIQLEALGPLPGLLKLLHQLESTGYPLLIDSLQFGSDATRPGPLKMSLVITILDFDQWKTQEATNAAT